MSKNYSDTRDFSFCLDWDELPEEIREEKIDEFMKSNYRDNLGLGYGTLEDYLENLHEREEAEESIKARFPMYF